MSIEGLLWQGPARCTVPQECSSCARLKTHSKVSHKGYVSWNHVRKSSKYLGFMLSSSVWHSHHLGHLRTIWHIPWNKRVFPTPSTLGERRSGQCFELQLEQVQPMPPSPSSVSTCLRSNRTLMSTKHVTNSSADQYSKGTRHADPCWINRSLLFKVFTGYLSTFLTFRHSNIF